MMPAMPEGEPLSNHTADRRAKRVLLIGWDAGDWDFARPLMDAGLMPTLQGMTRRGVWGNVVTLQPILSPMLWNSIATGKRPDKHGILGFAEPTPDGRSVRPVASTSRQCKALWNILSQNGLNSQVVGWYASHPAEPIQGVMVSNHLEAPRGKRDEPWPIPPRSVHPPELAETLAALRVHPGELEGSAIAPFVPALRDADPAKDPLFADLVTLLAQTVSIHSVATHLLANEEWDFAAVYYEGIDRFAHAFMHLHPPRMDHVDAEQFEKYRHVMTGVYRFHDMMLDTLLRLAGDDTAVVLLSDHGYYHDHRRPRDLKKAGPTDWHRPYGMVALQGPPFKQNEQLFGATLLDAAPTVLRLLGLPVGMDMDGRPWVEAFREPLEPHRIPSWELVPGEDGQHPKTADADAAFDPVAQREALDQLAALGYIEPIGDDEAAAVDRVRTDQRINLALSLIDAQRAGEAVPILEELHAEHPDDRGVRLQLAVCLANLGQTQRARELSTPFHDDPSPRGRLLLGALAAAEQDWDAALTHFDAAAQADPRLPGLHLRTGQALLAARRFADAEAAFRRALDADPTSAGAHCGLCEACLELGRADDAVTHGLAAVEHLFFFPQAHALLGRALAETGDTTRAIDALRVAVRQRPNHRRAHALLATLLKETGDEEHAAFHAAAAKAHRAGSASSEPPTAVAPLQPEPKTDPAVATNAAPETPPIVVVSGLPRSGTSLMMQMLKAGGTPALTDDRRGADESNPRGYLELDAVKTLPKDNAFLDDAPGHAVKVIHALLPALPNRHRYRVLFMDRDLDEVLASQRRMRTQLARGGEGTAAPAVDEDRLKATFARQLAGVKAWAASQTNVELLEVSHRELINNASPVVERVAAFLQGVTPIDLDTAAMAAAVDPSLYRQRAPKP